MKISNYIYLEIVSIFDNIAKTKDYVKYDFSKKETQIKFKDKKILEDKKGRYITHYSKKYYLSELL